MSKKIPSDLSYELELLLLCENSKIGHNDQKGHKKRKDLDSHMRDLLLYVLMNYCIMLFISLIKGLFFIF